MRICSRREQERKPSMTRQYRSLVAPAAPNKQCARRHRLRGGDCLRLPRRAVCPRQRRERYRAISSVCLTGKCGDDYGCSSSNGAIVDLWGCNGAAQYQTWQIMGDGSVRINGLCLDIKNFGTSDGSKVQLWTCSGASNQQWQERGFYLVNPASGRCLYAPSSTNGTQLEISACTGSHGEIGGFPGGAVTTMYDNGVSASQFSQVIGT